ncbi:hypothetical protein FHS68_002781 [Dyadobacter arcticus]|uniref:Uncharacterized protein n=1 Tax=Dyadobacter arcticus TaxID=1078754 RepID=A0ABX0UKS2_9BACT|nr:hypothetical protein [Dyadobacter arcticus]NIJ53599.1 hypothetical protein [Dyadobacter arcticus]
MSHHEDAIAIATGSSPSRTRKYQIGISQNIEEIRGLYCIEGFIADIDLEGNITGGYPRWDGT